MTTAELEYARALPSRPLSSRGLMRLIDASHWLTYWSVKVLMGPSKKRVKIHLSPADLRPDFCYVIAANHQSMADPFVVCAALPRVVWQRLRPYRYFAHNGLFEHPVLRNVMLALGSFPAHAHPRYASGLDAATTFLAHEQTVMIFPEGRRTRDRGPAKAGVSVLSSLPNVGVIPVRIEWQKSGSRRRLFRLVVGKPIHDGVMEAEAVLDRIYELPLD